MTDVPCGHAALFRPSERGIADAIRCAREVFTPPTDRDVGANYHGANQAIDYIESWLKTRGILGGEPVADIRNHKWLDPECHDGCQSLRFKEELERERCRANASLMFQEQAVKERDEARRQVEELTEELKSANTLLGDAGFYIRRMAKIVEGYNHPSRIHARALEWLRTKWKAVNLFTRWDREGRDVTNLPGLWSDEDVQVSATNFSHPTITSGQHTNGPALIWLKRCVDGAEWVNTGLTQMHKVRDAWAKANGDGCPNPLYQFGDIQ